MNLAGMGISLGVLSINGFLALYVVGLHPRKSLNHAAFLWALALVGAGVCEAIARAIPAGAPPQSFLIWAQGTAVFLGIALSALLHLGAAASEPRDAHRGWLHAALYLPAAGWAYVILGTGLVASLTAAGPLGAALRPGPTFLVLAALGMAEYLAGVGLLAATWRRSKKQRSEALWGVAVAGLLVLSVPASLTEVIWPSLSGTAVPFGLATLYASLGSLVIVVALSRTPRLVVRTTLEPPTASFPSVPSVPVEEGLSWLVLSPDRGAATGAFRYLASKTPGLCVTGLAPSRMARTYGLERAAVVWLTYLPAKGTTVPPDGLRRELLPAVLGFFREHPRGVVYLDDLDLLAAVNGFKSVATCVRRLARAAREVRGTLIVGGSRGAFPPRQAALLSASVDRVVEPRGRSATGRSRRDHAFLVVTPRDTLAGLAMVDVRRGLVVTTDAPDRWRDAFGEGFRFISVDEQGESGSETLSPRALRAEAPRILTEHLDANPDDDIILLGVDQLTLFLSFTELLGFVKDAIDITSVRGSRVIATVMPDGLTPHQFATLVRRFDLPNGPMASRRVPPLPGPEEDAERRPPTARARETATEPRGSPVFPNEVTGTMEAGRVPP